MTSLGKRSRGVALLLATGVFSACGNGAHSTRPPAPTPGGQLILSEPLYEKFGLVPEPNPARLLRLLHQVRGLDTTAREAWWRALGELDFDLACFLAIAGVESAGGSEPLLEYYEFAERQREVREVFPLYPAVWVGGLPYRLDAFDFMVGEKPGGPLLPAQPEDVKDWVRRGRADTTRHVADDPLAAMDAFLRSPEFAEFERRFVPARGTWTASQRAQDGRAKLREQAYRALGGILDWPLRQALHRWYETWTPTSDDEWRIACRAARERGVCWNPIRERFEWHAAPVDLASRELMAVTGDVESTADVAREVIAEADYRITEDRSEGSDHWFRTRRADGSSLRVFVRWLPSGHRPQTELEVRGV